MKKMRCKKCRYQWQSRKAAPVACPRCKRYDWRVSDGHVKPITEEVKAAS